MTVTISGTDGIVTPGLTNTGTETLVNLTTTGNTTLGDASTDTLNVGNGGLIKDASGNVGVGVTPSAWATFTSVLQNQGGAIACSGVNNIRVFQNSYYNGTNYIYKTTEAASRYDQQQGAHAWFNAASGTAGNTITFTQAMTLDASGNLLVGDTSAYSGSRLSVKTGNNNGTTHAWYAKNSSATVLGYQRDDGLFNTGAATNSPYNFTTASLANLFVDSSGTFYRGGVSALKYKQDVRDLEDIDISKFRPVRYKSACENDDQTIDHLGFIADWELQAGNGDLVILGDDGSPEGFQYERMTAVLTKVVQKQEAIIQTLTDRITALEAK